MLPSKLLLKKRKCNEHIAVCNAHIAVCNVHFFLTNVHIAVCNVHIAVCNVHITFSRPSKFSRNVNLVGKFSR